MSDQFASRTSAPAVGEQLRDSRAIPVERLADHLETSSIDDRSYRVIRLGNQLECLLVHDADTDKASAAMDINVGNFSDETDMPGMAHAVEHLLFMGTKKYPVENDYSQYLAANSGNSNAYTAGTSTNFYFEVAAQNEPSAEKSSEKPEESSPLFGALDRFAQFFIEPLFLASTLERELRAVDSENKKNLQTDIWRFHQLDKALANQKHPYSHFSTGNLETLKIKPEQKGIDVRAKFIEFHEKHYSANRMKLVILGRESLDTLESWAVDLFSGVPNKDLPQNRWEDEAPYSEKQLCMEYYAKPVMESRSLDVTFQVPEEEPFYEEQPSRYASHLIGHEGPGSIMAYLKGKGWANGLSAGGYDLCPGSPGLFSIQIRLTEDGLNNYREIVKIIFQYVAMLRETPPQEWVWAEQAGMAEVDFKFKQKTPASKFTSRTSSVMQKPLPRELLLSGYSRLRKFNGDLVSKYLESFRPDNFRLAVVSQTFPGEWGQKEKWYGTEYKYQNIPEEVLQDLQKAVSSSAKERPEGLHLPHRNQFIPTKFEVEKKDIKEPAKAPRLIRCDENVHAWFKKDDTFWVPKANLYISIRNPLPGATAENALKARIYTDLVKDALEEYAYDAEIAGLDYSVTSYSMGLDVSVSGYNDKLPVLLEKVLVTMRDLVVKPERFEIVKERLQRGLRNYELQQPYYQVGDYTRWLNSERGFINDQLLVELPYVTAQDIQEFFPHLLRQMHIVTFVHGNIYKEDALGLTNLVESTLKPRILPQTQWPTKRALLFPPGSDFVYPKTLKDPANINHCIEYLLFIGDKSNRPLRSKVLLLDQMTHEPAFDVLRTKEQLGYVVFSGQRATSTTIGFRFIIQSERTPEYLESRIDAFLTNFGKTLEEMPESEFESHKRSLIAKRLEKMKNLSEESSRHWNHIDNEYFDFEMHINDAEHVRALTKSDMIEFFQHYMHPSSTSRAKLSVHLFAQASAAAASDYSERISAALDLHFENAGIKSQPTAFKERLESAGKEPQGILAAVTQHLTEDLKIASEKVKELVEEGMKGLGLVGAEEKKEVNGEVQEKKKPVVIENVREFKAMLAISAGPLPVKDLSEFQDLDVKL